MKRLCAAGLLLVLVLSAPTWAIHVFDPPWVTNPSDPQWAGGSATSQSWEFWGNPLGTTSPEHVNNPYGLPQFVPINASPQFEPNGPGLTGVNTWHVDVTGGGFDIYIPNDPEPRPEKLIHLQYTSDKAALGAPSTTPGGTAQAGGVAGHGPSSGGDAWYTYEWMLTIRPNPQFEIIHLTFPQSANIGEIEISTLCHVPEPGTLGLFAFGATALVGFACLRRRR